MKEVLKKIASFYTESKTHRFFSAHSGVSSEVAKHLHVPANTTQKCGRNKLPLDCGLFFKTLAESFAVYEDKNSRLFKMVFVSCI